MRHRIITPENVELSFEIAGLTARFLAWLMDFLLMIAICLGAVLVIGIIIGRVSPGLSAALQIIAVFLVYMGYFIFFELKTGGTTPGKKAMKLRVIRDTGVHITFFNSFIRNIMRLMDSTPLMVLHLPGALVAFFHPLRRRLGDLVAGTLVVRERSYPAPGKIIAEGDRYSTLLENFHMREKVKRIITTAEKEAMIDACLRADEIEVSHRLDIFSRLGRHLRAKLDLPPMEFASDEKLVRNITAALLGAEPSSGKKG